MNAASAFYETILRRRRPLALMPDRYFHPSAAFSDLRRFTYMTRKQLADKLGVSESMLQKMEGGMVGGNAQLDTVDRAIQLAADYSLHKIHAFLNLYRNSLRMRPKRGPRAASRADKWYLPEAEGVS